MRRLRTLVARGYGCTSQVARRVCIGMIRAYQRTAPYRPRTCRFVPSCSEYAAQAIAKHGVFKGIVLGSWRILRCNPFCKGGYDPVK